MYCSIMKPEITEEMDLKGLEGQYRDEWLLIEITQTDEVDRPLKGRLLGHSPSRSEIHQVAMATRVKDRRYWLTYTGDPIPPDMVVVF